MLRNKAQRFRDDVKHLARLYGNERTMLYRRHTLYVHKDVTIIQPRYAHIENLDCLVHSSNRVL